MIQIKSLDSGVRLPEFEFPTAPPAGCLVMGKSLIPLCVPGVLWVTWIMIVPASKSSLGVTSSVSVPIPLDEDTEARRDLSTSRAYHVVLQESVSQTHATVGAIETLLQRHPAGLAGPA